MELMKPAHNSDLTLKDLGGELLIYSSQQKAIHVLNPTAQLIWELCDGAHSIEEMEQALRASFSIPAGRDLIADIQSTLNTFREKGLLTPSPEPE